MKKYCGIFLCLAFLAFKTNVRAQTPDPVVYNFEQLAIEHNDALDYLHLNYSNGGPYNLHQVYNFVSDYCNINNKPMPSLSYQEMMNIKNQVTDLPGLIILMQSQYNFFTLNEKNELISLYSSLISATSDDEIEVVLQNFDAHIASSNYTEFEKNKLLGFNPALRKISDFWATTDDFMQHPGERRPWAQSVTDDPLVFDFFKNSNNTFLVNTTSFHGGPYAIIDFGHPEVRRCRFFCVLCVAIHDVVMTLATHNPVAGALWSVFARCCICSRCGNTSCTGDK